MKEIILSVLAKKLGKDPSTFENILEVPQDSSHGDFAFPCFLLARELKKNPVQIAQDLARELNLPKEIERCEAKGPYLNFFINRNSLAEKTLNKILKEKERYGSSTLGRGKTVVIDMSSPNIAKPFGIGHLRSTIIGNAIVNIGKFQGYKLIKINYLGDWGTPFGKIIAAYQEFGDPKKFKENAINHLYEIYVKASQDKSFEEKGRQMFKRLAQGDKKIVAIWKKFRKESLKEFDKIYKLLDVSFDVITGESEYEKYIPAIVEELKEKSLLKEDQGAQIVDLKEHELNVALIQKSDGTTLYTTRDLALAIQRYKKYKFTTLLYEVGSEQKLNFQQLFKILELMGFSWAKDCKHISHGLYLDQDGKKFSTRKGKTFFMEEILQETLDLAKEEINRRGKLSGKELNERALIIARAAIIYGDLKNYREQNAVFDIERFLSFEGDTGPYLLYTYARAKSILQKAKKSKGNKTGPKLTDKEKQLVIHLAKFPEVVATAYSSFAPNLIANYSYQLAQSFNEFYHSHKVLGSPEEASRLQIVRATSQVLKNALSLLGIAALEKM
ncbi:arginine--tRNA ligase [Candidatus Pacearchaeota archaeon]|nr:arginine--tRNA ligase [Candidatus Pacearchaeota archaeon]